MNFRVLCIGKIKDSFYRDAISDICNEINHGQNFIEIKEFPDEKIPERINDKIKNNILNTEGKRIEIGIDKSDYVVALCIEGKEIDTARHSKLVNEAKESGYGRISYIIGGSLGLSDDIKKRADKKISFSKMTFPHQLMRMVLCEEIANVSGHL